MADIETKRIIEVEAKYETLADLRTALTEANKELEKIAEGVEQGTNSQVEYEKALTEVKAAQQEYNAAQRITVKEVNAATGSYNDLVNQLARLKEKWKQADPKSDAYKELTAQVNKTKLQLENMDHSIGNYQRNVGNYANSIKDAAGYFGQTGSAAGKAIGQIGGVTTGLKALSATPVIAILGALVTIVQKVIESFKSSEKNVIALTAAMAPLKSVGDLVSKVFQGLGSVVVKVAEWFGQLADKMGLVSDEMKERKALAEEDIRIMQDQRKALMENAKAEREAAELRSKAADKNKYSAEERIKYLEEAGQKEKEIMERNRDLAQREYDQIRAKNALTESSTEELDAEAQAYVKLQQAEMSYFSKTKEITGQVAELRNQLGVKASAVWNGIKTDAEDAEFYIEEIDIKAIQAKEKRDDKAAADARARRQKYALEALDDETKKQLDLNEVSGESERARAEQEYQIQLESNNRKLELLRQFAAEATQAGDVTAYLNYQQQASDLEYKIWLNGKKREVKVTQQTDKEKLASAQAYARGVTSIMSVVSAVWTSNIKQQVESGKITAEEGEKQFQSVKALQYATTWINTLAAMISALADPSVPSYAIKAINAAAAFASGVAATVQIASTSLGASTSATSSGSSVSSSSSSSSTSSASSSGSTASQLATTIYENTQKSEPEQTKSVEGSKAATAEQKVEKSEPEQTKSVEGSKSTFVKEKVEKVEKTIEKTTETVTEKIKQTETIAPAPQNMTTPTTRVVTTEEDEKAISERQKAQRVYVVYSDIEGVGKRVQVQQSEASF